MSSIMWISLILLWIFVLLNLLLTVGLIRRFNRMSKEIAQFPAMQEGLEIGTPAPDFHAETLTGEIVSLAHYARQAVSFIFVAPSCSPCVEELPTLNRLAPKAKAAGVEMILVNTEGDKAETETFIKKYNIALPVLIAPFESNPFANDYKAPGTPFFCMLNRESKVEATGMLGPEWEQLTQAWAA